MNWLWTGWMKIWNAILNFGKIPPKTQQDIVKLVVTEFIETELACLHHMSLAEYHDAMSAMLFHRRKRLVEDPFNSRFFNHQEDDDFAPPPPVKKENGDSGPTKPH